MAHREVSIQYCIVRSNYSVKFLGIRGVLQPEFQAYTTDAQMKEFKIYLIIIIWVILRHC